ncbi:MAG TPA: hypothetical protein VHX39_35265 [Acetobacteraceae bacterium]|nr:hypothetical protein [Acetobacteraceae bacterium]
MLTSRAPDPGHSFEAPGIPTEASVSAISWQAILGGAAAAASISAVLVLLGLGLGFAAISPWPNAGATAATFSIIGGIWLIVVQWISSGIGGFVTGRLRTKWVNVHTHEVFFRDTAHGFLTWAVAALLGALILASAASSAVGTATRATGTAAAGAAQAATRAYDADMLYRGEKPELATSDQQTEMETTRILARGVENGGISDGDKAYLVDQVAARTGLSHDDAQKRVDDVVAQEKAAETKAREAADTARKSASAVSIFTALSMLIGAFIASAAAAYGGSLRDEHP